MREQEGEACSCHAEKTAVPIEEALKAMIEAGISEKETEKGIPFVSFVAREGDGAAFISPLPLPEADRCLEGQAVAAGSEILYRVDYVESGNRKFIMGVLSTGEEPETFLKLLESNTGAGSRKADIMGIRGYLEAHFALCRLERLAREGTKERREADSSYYREILAYVEKGRRYLNGDAGDPGIPPPPFPQRNIFMAGWYQDHKGIAT